MAKSNRRGRKLTQEEIDINTPEGRRKLFNKPIVFLCCFCGKGVKKPKVMISTMKQAFWAHRKCLSKRLCKACKENVK